MNEHLIAGIAAMAAVWFFRQANLRGTALFKAEGRADYYKAEYERLLKKQAKRAKKAGEVL